MHEVLVQAFAYLLGIWRFRWIVLFASWGIAIAGWGFVAQMPEQYVATARIYVDSNSVLRPLLRGVAIEPDISQRVQLMSGTLLSRPNLEKLMRMADLDIQAQTDSQKEKMLDSLAKSIALVGDRRDPSLYSISYEHPNRDVSKRVVQSLITVFIESTLGEKREDSSGAQSFIDQQIAEYEKRMTAAESRLAEFKQRYVGILPGESGGYYQRLSTARENLNNAQLQLNEMEKRREDLKRQLEDANDPMFFSEWSNATISPLDSRIQALQSKLDELLTKYTERHPEVVQIQKMIAELQTERQQELDQAMADGPGPTPGLAENPVYQQMRGLLSESDANVAELRIRVAEHQARVKDLEEKVNSIPLIEAELTQLNRDYEVIRGQHSTLMERRESARISQDVEQNVGDVTFRVIDPPFAPLKPNKPNKLILNSVVLALALAVAAGIGLLLSLIRPVFIEQRSLGEITGLPVLGTVMAIRSAAENRRAFVRKMVFSSMTLVLVLVYAGINIGQQWI